MVKTGVIALMMSLTLTASAAVLTITTVVTE
jgi:hypothetical protein